MIQAPVKNGFKEVSMLKENSKYSMGRIFSLISFIVIICMCIAHIVLAFYGKKIDIPTELLYTFCVTMGYTANSKVQGRLKEKDDAIHKVI